MHTTDKPIRAHVALCGEGLPNIRKNFFRSFLPSEKCPDKCARTTWEILALLFRRWDDNSIRVIRKENGSHFVVIKIYSGDYANCKPVEEYRVLVRDVSLVTDLRVRGYIIGTSDHGRKKRADDGFTATDMGIEALAAHLEKTDSL